MNKYGQQIRVSAGLGCPSAEGEKDMVFAEVLSGAAEGTKGVALEELLVMIAVGAVFVAALVIYDHIKKPKDE